MFEKDLTLTRQYKIFRHLLTYHRNVRAIPHEFSGLTIEILQEFKKYDKSPQFVFDVYKIYLSMCHMQFFALMSGVPKFMHRAMIGIPNPDVEPPNQGTGQQAANLYLNNLFGVKKILPFFKTLDTLPEPKRSDYILNFAACYCPDIHVQKFKRHLTVEKSLEFDEARNNMGRIKTLGKSMYDNWEKFQEKLGSIFTDYSDNGVLHYTEGGERVMIDFDLWLQESGHKSAHTEALKSLKKIPMLLDDIIAQALTG